MDYGDIRKGIYNHLCTEIATVSNRVFWSHTAPADSTKPLLEFSFAGELPPASGNPCGFFQQVDVEVYGEESNILDIDSVADAVVSALHQVPITTPASRIIYMRYVPSARFDDWNERLRASMIRLKFVFATDLWT